MAIDWSKVRFAQDSEASVPSGGTVASTEALQNIGGRWVCTLCIAAHGLCGKDLMNWPKASDMDGIARHLLEMHGITVRPLVRFTRAKDIEELP